MEVKRLAALMIHHYRRFIAQIPVRSEIIIILEIFVQRPYQFVPIVIISQVNLLILDRPPGGTLLLHRLQISGYTEDIDVLNSQWDEFDGVVGNLEMPFFYVPGNHDISNNCIGSYQQENRLPSKINPKSLQ